jgi:hypothetical protein
MSRPLCRPARGERGLHRFAPLEIRQTRYALDLTRPRACLARAFPPFLHQSKASAAALQIELGGSPLPALGGGRRRKRAARLSPFRRFQPEDYQRGRARPRASPRHAKAARSGLLAALSGRTQELERLAVELDAHGLQPRAHRVLGKSACWRNSRLPYPDRSLCR